MRAEGCAAIETAARSAASARGTIPTAIPHARVAKVSVRRGPPARCNERILGPRSASMKSIDELQAEVVWLEGQNVSFSSRLCAEVRTVSSTPATLTSVWVGSVCY